jgi:hypothetical protein
MVRSSRIERTEEAQAAQDCSLMNSLPSGGMKKAWLAAFVPVHEENSIVYGRYYQKI